MDRQALPLNALLPALKPEEEMRVLRFFTQALELWGREKLYAHLRCLAIENQGTRPHHTCLNSALNALLTLYLCTEISSSESDSQEGLKALESAKGQYAPELYALTGLAPAPSLSAVLRALSGTESWLQQIEERRQLYRNLLALSEDDLAGADRALSRDLKNLHAATASSDTAPRPLSALYDCYLHTCLTSEGLILTSRHATEEFLAGFKDSDLPRILLLEDPGRSAVYADASRLCDSVLTCMERAGSARKTLRLPPVREMNVTQKTLSLCPLSAKTPSGFKTLLLLEDRLLSRGVKSARGLRQTAPAPSESRAVPLAAALTSLNCDESALCSLMTALCAFLELPLTPAERRSLPPSAPSVTEGETELRLLKSLCAVTSLVKERLKSKTQPISREEYLLKAYAAFWFDS